MVSDARWKTSGYSPIRQANRFTSAPFMRSPTFAVTSHYHHKTLTVTARCNSKLLIIIPLTGNSTIIHSTPNLQGRLGVLYYSVVVGISMNFHVQYKSWLNFLYSCRSLCKIRCNFQRNLLFRNESLNDWRTIT